MKGYINTVALLLMVSTAVRAQKTNPADGIYIKAGDFKNQHVQEQLTAGDRLQTNSLFGGAQIKYKEMDRQIKSQRMICMAIV